MDVSCIVSEIMGVEMTTQTEMTFKCPSRSSKVAPIAKLVYDLLLVVYGNVCCITHCPRNRWLDQLRIENNKHLLIFGDVPHLFEKTVGLHDGSPLSWGFTPVTRAHPSHKGSPLSWGLTRQKWGWRYDLRRLMTATIIASSQPLWLYFNNKHLIRNGEK